MGLHRCQARWSLVIWRIDTFSLSFGSRDQSAQLFHSAISFRTLSYPSSIKISTRCRRRSGSFKGLFFSFLVSFSSFIMFPLRFHPYSLLSLFLSSLSYSVPSCCKIKDETEPTLTRLNPSLSLSSAKDSRTKLNERPSGVPAGLKCHGSADDAGCEGVIFERESNRKRVAHFATPTLPLGCLSSKATRFRR